MSVYIFSSVVSEEGIGMFKQTSAISDKDLPSLAERAKIVQDQGALAISQIVHCGLSGSKKFWGKTPLSPSANVSNEYLEKNGRLNDDNRNE